MKFAYLIVLCLALASCNSTPATHESSMSRHGGQILVSHGNVGRFIVSSEPGPEFTITGYTAQSYQMLTDMMTYKAAMETTKRGYQKLALVSSTRGKQRDGGDKLTATFRAYRKGDQTGGLQTLDADQYIKAKSHEVKLGNQRSGVGGSRKYGGGLFMPTTPAGRAVDEALDKIF